MQPDSVKYHNLLAGFFESKSLYLDEPACQKPAIRKLVELPWQQTQAELWDDVTNTLCNLDFIQAKAAAKKTYDLVNDFNEVLVVIPDNAENIQKEKARQERMEKYTRDLIACAKGKISGNELENPESITPCPPEKIDAEIERIKTNPARLDKLKDFINFLGQEAGNLQNYAQEIPHFAIQQGWNWANSGFVGSMAENISNESRESLLLLKKDTRPAWNPFSAVILVLKEHSSCVNTVAITPDGKKAFSGSDDKTCIFWNLETGNIINTFTGHTVSITYVAITPDAKKAVSGSNDGTCICWDLVGNRKMLTFKGYSGKISKTLISADGNKAGLIYSDGTLVIWDLEYGQVINLFKEISNGREYSLITSDFKWFICMNEDGDAIIIVDIESGQIIQTLKWNVGRIKALAISPDRKILLSISEESQGSVLNRTSNFKFIFWEVDNGQSAKSEIPDISFIDHAAITPDLSKAIFRTGRELILFNIEKNKVIKKIGSLASNIYDVTITPDGRKALSCSTDNCCRLWNLETGKFIENRITLPEFVQSIDFSPDGRIAILGTGLGKIIFWDTLENTIIFEKEKEGIEWGAITSVTFIPDGIRAVSGSEKGVCKIWSIPDKKILLTFKGPVRPVDHIEVLPDGKTGIVNFSGICSLRDLNTGDELFNFQTEFRESKKLIVSPDGKLILSRTFNTCKLWDIKTRQLLKKLDGHNTFIDSFAFSPDGRKVISSSNGDSHPLTSLITKLLFCDIRNNETIQSLHKNLSEIKEFIFTRDTKRIIINSKENSFWSVKGFMIIYNLISGRKERLFPTESLIKAIKNKSDGIVCYSTQPLVFENTYELKNSQPSIVTVKKIWNFKSERYFKSSADCSYCGHRFEPPVSVLNTIEKITKKAGLKPHQSPCLELPDEAWEEPGLLGECPDCHGKLKFNPFIAGGDDSRPSWKFWKK